MEVWVNLNGMKVGQLKNWMLNPMKTIDRIALGGTLTISNTSLFVFDIDEKIPYIWGGTSWLNIVNTNIQLANENQEGIIRIATEQEVIDGILSNIAVSPLYLHNYITSLNLSYTETDPIFTAHPSFNITSQNILDWDSAFSWGNHALQNYLTASSLLGYATESWVNSQGFLTSFTETDPTVPLYSKSLLDFSIIKADTDLLYEPIILNKLTAFNKDFGTIAGTVTEGNDIRILNGQTAFSWGNHLLAGYLTSITSLQINTALGYTPYDGALNPNNYITSLALNGYATESWVGTNYYNKIDSDARYLQGFIETDPTVPSYAKTLSGFSVIRSQTDLLYQPIGVYLTSESDPTVSAYAKSLTSFSIIQASTDILYQPKDGDLTAIAAISGTNGLLKKTGIDTWVLDTTSYALQSSLSRPSNEIVYGNATNITSSPNFKYASGNLIVANGVNDPENSFTSGVKLKSNGTIVMRATNNPVFLTVGNGGIVRAGSTENASDGNFLASYFGDNTEGFGGVGFRIINASTAKITYQTAATFYIESRNTGTFFKVTPDGLIIPTKTTTQRNAIASPAMAQLIYNSTSSLFNYYTGSLWTDIPSVVVGTAAPTTTPISVGQFFVDSTNKKAYISTGTTNSSDWTILN